MKSQRISSWLLFVMSIFLSQGIAAEVDEWGDEITPKSQAPSTFRPADFLFLMPFPIPEPLKNFLQDVVVANVISKPGPEGFSASSVLAGDAEVKGKKTPIELTTVTLKDKKNGYSLKFPKDDTRKFSEIVPGFTLLDSLKITKPFFIISNFAYTDPELHVAIRPGVTIVAAINLADLKLPDVVANLIKGPTIPVQAVLPKKMQDAFFMIDLSENDLKLKSLTLSSILYIPAALIPGISLDDIVLNVKKMSVQMGFTSRKVFVEGVTSFFGTDIASTLRIRSGDISSTSLLLKLPEIWRLSEMFPSLKQKLDIPLIKPMMLLSNVAYTDEVYGFVQKGLNFMSEVNFADLQMGGHLQKLAQRVGGTIGRVKFGGTLKAVLADSLLFATLPLKNKEIILREFLTGLGDLADQVASEISNALITVQSAQINVVPTETGVGLQLAIDATIKKIFNGDAQCVIRIVQGKDGSPRGTFKIELPKKWKISDTFKTIKGFDSLTLENAVLVITNVLYRDEALKLDVGQGVTLLAGIDLTGPLAELKNLIDTSFKKLFSADVANITFIGNVQRDLTKSTFGLNIPIHVHLDFESLYNKGFPLTPVRSLTTDDLLITLAANLAYTIRAGLTLSIVDQEDIKLRGMVSIKPENVVFSGAMDGTYESAFGINWLDLQDFAFEVVVLQATGLPSGLAFRGNMLFGKNNEKFAIAAKVDFSARGGLGGFVFDGFMPKATLTELVELLAKMINKPITLETVPTLEFSDLAMKVVPTRAEIAGKVYQAGILGSGSANIFGRKANLKFEIEKVSDPMMAGSMSGSGYLSKIDKPLFKLTGKGPDEIAGTADDGPIVKIEVSPRTQRVFVSGLLTIPPLALNQQTEIDLTPLGGRAMATYKISDKFEVTVDLTVDIQNPLVWHGKFEFKNDFLNYLNQEIVKGMKTFKEDAYKQIDDIDLRINDLQGKIDNFNKTVSKGADEEIRKTENRIVALKREITALQDECDNASRSKKSYICPKVGLQISAKGAELSGLEIYKEGLVKPGTVVVTGGAKVVGMSTQSLAHLTEKIAELTDLKKGVQHSIDAIGKLGELAGDIIGKTFNIKRIYGEVEPMQFLAGGPGAQANVDAMVLGKDLKLEAAIDLNNTVYFIDNLVALVVMSLERAF